MNIVEDIVIKKVIISCPSLLFNKVFISTYESVHMHNFYIDNLFHYKYSTRRQHNLQTMYVSDHLSKMWKM